MKLSNILGLIVILALGAFLYSRFGPERVVTIVEYETEQIDEDLWVSKANYTTQRQMLEDLRSEKSQILTQLDETNEKLQQSTQVLANLRLERDSLANNPTIITLNEAKLDTTLTYIYGDSLIAVAAIISLDSLRFSHDIKVEQLRPIALRAITTTDAQGVNFYVESKDLEIVDINSYVLLDKPRYKWYHYFGAGIVAGVVAWELIK